MQIIFALRYAFLQRVKEIMAEMNSESEEDDVSGEFS
jgi:hypothetical protein